MEINKLSSVAKRFTPSAIRELSRLAESCGAVNLSEGFPDFPAPSHVKEAAVSAILSDLNQYRDVQGVCELLAAKMKEMHGLDVDPLTDITICCGQTEAFTNTIFAIIDRGDEVLLFDPSYETYDACIRMAGGIPVYVALEPPNWSLDAERFFNAFSDKTKAVILNSPQNPPGKVFSRDELELIAELCRERDCLAVTDEVYEIYTYDDVKHISLASLPGMQNRTIITSSLSKTFNVTGWRVGWAIAPTYIASAIKNIHVKMTDCAPSPFQEAALAALRTSPDYFESLRSDYESKRDYVMNMLTRFGFKIKFKPQGSFFLFTELPEGCQISDVDYAKNLIQEAGIAAVPGCGFFYSDSSAGYNHKYIRFAFCKSNTTLAAAAKSLSKSAEVSASVSRC